MVDDSSATNSRADQVTVALIGLLERARNDPAFLPQRTPTNDVYSDDELKAIWWPDDGWTLRHDSVDLSVFATSNGVVTEEHRAIGVMTFRIADGVLTIRTSSLTLWAEGIEFIHYKRELDGTETVACDRFFRMVRKARGREVELLEDQNLIERLSQEAIDSRYGVEFPFHSRWSHRDAACEFELRAERLRKVLSF